MSEIEICANCGKSTKEGAALKNCKACYLVKYCSVECQKAHRKKHKKVCKQQAEKLKEESLFKTGLKRFAGDCPICMRVLPIDHEQCIYKKCCFTEICIGCIYAVEKQGRRDCPFCRTPNFRNDRERLTFIQERVRAGIPSAMYCLGEQYFAGKMGLRKNMERGIELWTQAAELGNVEARFNLGLAFLCGDGVGQDFKTAFEHWTLAAMSGHPEARHQLGVFQLREKRRPDLALKHFMISAKMGFEESLNTVKTLFMTRLATRDAYAEALAGYQIAHEEMKSPDREEAIASGMYTMTRVQSRPGSISTVAI